MIRPELAQKIESETLLTADEVFELTQSDSVIDSKIIQVGVDFAKEYAIAYGANMQMFALVFVDFVRNGWECRDQVAMKVHLISERKHYLWEPFSVVVQC